MNLTDKFIDYLCWKYLNITPQAEDQAQQCLMDFVACAAGGSKQNKALALAFAFANGTCDILGTDKKASAEQAAFVNGFNAHSTELDDGHRFGMVHIGGVVVSAVLALAQEYDLPKEQILRSIIMGYEATARLAQSINPGHKKRGFHTTGTCGTIGAALALAFAIAPNDIKKLKAVLSAATTSAAGVLEIQENASELKAINVANAAMTAVSSARLAKADFMSPDDILGGNRGFLNLLTDGLDEEKLLSHTDKFEIERRYVKLYAACRHCHSAIEATIRLRSEQIRKASDVQSITVRTYNLAIKGHDHKVIKGAQSAKLSMPYSVAAAYLYGKVGEEEYAESILASTELHELINKVNVVEEEEFTSMQTTKRIASVEIVNNDGTCITCRVDYAKGDPENQVTESELQSKFETLTQGTVTSKYVERIIK